MILLSEQFRADASLILCTDFTLPPYTLLESGHCWPLSTEMEWLGWGEGPGVGKVQQGPSILIHLWLEVGRKKTQLKY